MSYYVIFNGVDSRELNLHIEMLPPKVSPQQRYTTTAVSGRHGVLTETDGTFEPYTQSVEFTALDLSKLDKICSVFKGISWLTLSNELHRKYKARVANAIEFSQIIRLWRRFIVQFEVQPFGYETQPQNFIATNNSKIFNYGTYESEPKIIVYGAGDITLNINGAGIILKGVTDKIIIDSEMQNAYNGSVLMNQNMNGEFPIFKVGENTISWTGNASKVAIEPNWRWV